MSQIQSRKKQQRQETASLRRRVDSAVPQAFRSLGRPSAILKTRLRLEITRELTQVVGIITSQGFASCNGAAIDGAAVAFERRWDSTCAGQKSSAADLLGPLLEVLGKDLVVEY